MCKNNKMNNSFCFGVILTLFVVFTESRRVKRIVGGSEVECGEDVRVASLQNSTTLSHLCGAYIISQEFALTAAHCVAHPAHHYILQLNNHCNDVKPRAEVLQVFVHELYDKYSSAHDIAILRISLGFEEELWIHDDILPRSPFGLAGECTIFGYGSTSRLDPKETSDSLKSAEVVIMSLDYCTEALGPIAPHHDSGMMCALGELADTCQGDSGGPLICKGLLEGISSHGLSCGVPGVPGVYTSVGAHLTWIRQIINTS